MKLGRSALGSIVLVLAAASLTTVAVLRRSGAARDTPRAVPKWAVHPTGHVVKDGDAAEIIAFIDANCADCGDFLNRFESHSRADSHGARFAIVPYVADSSASGALRAMAMACAEVEGNEITAVKALLSGAAVLDDIASFGKRIGQKNIADYVSCVDERRFQVMVDRHIRLADGFTGDEPIINVRAPAELKPTLRATLGTVDPVR